MRLRNSPATERWSGLKRSARRPWLEVNAWESRSPIATAQDRRLLIDQSGTVVAARNRLVAQPMSVIVPESLATPAVPAPFTDPLRLPLAPVKRPVPPTITSVSVPKEG